jgi:hypothetical protein
VPVLVAIILAIAALSLLGMAALLVWKPRVAERLVPEALRSLRHDDPVKPNGT